ncbi:MAG: hypothetical protein FJX56_01855 [Alphaproteobacteria bacterium]|nr:hypothetical protein [Alphaproteobacteria bacterium]
MSAAAAIETGPADAKGRAFALHGQRAGRWRLDALFDDLTVAQFEAEHLAEERFYDAVRVDALTDLRATATTGATMIELSGRREETADPPTGRRLRRWPAAWAVAVLTLGAAFLYLLAALALSRL